MINIFKPALLTGLITLTLQAAALSGDSYTITASKPWLIAQDTQINTLIIQPGGQIVRPGKSVTMLVNGKESAIEPGTYKNVELIITDKFNQSPAGTTARGVDEFRAALYVDSTGIVDKYSVEQAIPSGSFDEKSAESIAITSSSQNFNGIMVNGPVDYTIDKAVFDFRGHGNGSNVSDFSGFGAAIAAYNGARVTIENSDIKTAGVARLGVFSYEDADVLVKDSTISVAGGDLYEGYPNSADFSIMVAPPWVLGITGSARGTNMMGNRTSFTLVNSDVSAANWGVVSTDMGAAMLLTVVDSTLTLNGEKDLFSPHYGSGYGTYILGSEQFYYGVTINAGTYGGIVREGQAYYGSSHFDEPLAIYPRLQIPTGKTQIDFFGNEQPVFDVKPDSKAVFSGIQGKSKPSVINSDNFGWMSHGDGKVTLTDGTKVNTGNTTFLLKDGNVDIALRDNALLTPANGILVQLMDNDDMLVGLQQDSGLALHFNTEFSEKAGYPSIDYPVSTTRDASTTVNVTADHISLRGDMFNATGYFGGQSGDTLNVTLGKDSKLTGTISATSAIHIDEHGKQNTHFTQQEYYYLGHVANKQFDNGVNEVNVVLKAGSQWQVTGTSMLHSLTIEEGAQLTGPNLIMKLNGKSIPVAAGRYEGSIELKIK